MYRALILCCSALFWLAGCATAPSTLPAEKLASIRDVGVISLLGDDIHLTHIGLTVFGNTQTSHAVNDWEIDKHAMEVLQASLQKTGTYQAREITFDRAALMQVYTDSVYSPVDFKLVAAELAEIAQAHGIDTFVVVTRYSAQDPVGHRSVYYEGAGLFSSGIGDALIKVAPYVWYKLDVVDGKTAQVVASTRGTVKQKNPGLFGPEYTLPYEEVDKSWWNEDFNAMSETQKNQLRDKLKELLSDSLPHTLEEINLKAPLLAK